MTRLPAEGGSGGEGARTNSNAWKSYFAVARSAEIGAAFALALIPILCVGTMQERLSEIENLLHYLL